MYTASRLLMRRKLSTNFHEKAPDRDPGLSAFEYFQRSKSDRHISFLFQRRCWNIIENGTFSGLFGFCFQVFGIRCGSGSAGNSFDHMTVFIDRDLHYYRSFFLRQIVDLRSFGDLTISYFVAYYVVTGIDLLLANFTPPPLPRPPA